MRIPFPRIAGSGNAAVAAATREYRQQAKIIDPRLARPTPFLKRLMLGLSWWCALLKEFP